MSKSKDIYLLGYSGHAYVVLDIALSNGLTVKGYFDIKKAQINPYGISFFGSETDKDFKSIVAEAYVFPAVGSNSLREKLAGYIESKDLKQLVLADSTAFVSDKAAIGSSTLVGPMVVINSMAHVGKGCIINTGAIIEHECEIGNFVHLAPGVVLTGNVRIGNKTFVGANTVVKQGLVIGNNVTIGAGAVVLRDVPDGETWVGNPAVKIR